MYLEEFKSKDDVVKQFEIDESALNGADILLAWYGYGSYCGHAFVLFRRAGKLYTVEGSHCSCYGIEGQWEPVETSVAALQKVNFYDEYDGFDKANSALKQIVDGLAVG